MANPNNPKRPWASTLTARTLFDTPLRESRPAKARRAAESSNDAEETEAWIGSETQRLLFQPLILENPIPYGDEPNTAHATCDDTSHFSSSPTTDSNHTVEDTMSYRDAPDSSFEIHGDALQHSSSPANQPTSEDDSDAPVEENPVPDEDQPNSAGELLEDASNYSEPPATDSNNSDDSYARDPEAYMTDHTGHKIKKAYKWCNSPRHNTSQSIPTSTNSEAPSQQSEYRSDVSPSSTKTNEQPTRAVAHANSPRPIAPKPTTAVVNSNALGDQSQCSTDGQNASTAFGEQSAQGSASTTAPSLAVPMGKTISPPAEPREISRVTEESDGIRYETFCSHTPKDKRIPIILLHGDFHDPKIWTEKPDGGKGWALKLAQLGHDVHIVDFNLSPFETHDKGGQFMPWRIVQETLTATSTRPQTKDCAWTMCKNHDKWPGTGKKGDPIFDKYYTTLLQPVFLDKQSRQNHAQMVLINTLPKIGKAVLIGEGTGAQAAWLAADAIPELVHGVIAIEPLSGPFGTPARKVDGVVEYGLDMEHKPGCREYGLTDVPLTFEPPLPFPNAVSDSSNGEPTPPPLNIQKVVMNGSRGPRRLWLQSKHKMTINTDSIKCRDEVGTRKLSQLSKVKHVVITSPTSYHAIYDYATVAFMRQAGLATVWKQLRKEGLNGNSRLMFLETNSDAIAVKISE